ncbi:MAG: hypothetical protein ACRET2_06560, partial [Steroidobacteraceae bacterium]
MTSPSPANGVRPTDANPTEPAVQAEIEDLSPPPRSRSKTWWVRLISIIVVLVAWEIVGRRINPLFMSYPSAIVKAGIRMAADGELW